MKKRLSLLLILLIFTAPLLVVAATQESPSKAAHTEAGMTPPGGQNETAATEGDEEGKPSHEEAVARILLAIIIILVAAKVGGEIAEQVHQPAVLGELLFGVIIGNLSLFGFHGLDFLKGDFTIEVLAEIGVILLLFEVGLESNIKEMMAVGASSFLVASAGVIAPAILGYWVSTIFIPEETFLAHIFIGAILCATSVGITARVLKDLNKLNTKEARIILGAAVIDDIMGLVVLAVVSGVITAVAQGSHLNAWGVIVIVIKAVAFYVVALVAGQWLSPRIFNLASHLRVHGMLLMTALGICFFLSWAAALIGLAPIVGAFAAGLILDEVHYKEFSQRGEKRLDDLLAPLATFLVPVFFVLMGIKVDLTYFGKTEILVFALFLTLAAIIGKQVCSLAILEKGVNRLAVGVGMIPRGEVGLIFAGIGTHLMLKGEPVVTPGVFGASVIMVILTTLVTPPILKLLLQRMDKKRAGKGDG